MLGDVKQLERSVAKMTHDRRARDAFRGEVFVAMGRHRGAPPVKVAQACIQERVKRLMTRKMLGWARVPKTPNTFVLVDPKGCVITGLDAKEIASARRVGMPELVKERDKQKIIDAAKQFITTGEGNKTFIYPDSENNPTIGIGHWISSENNLRTIFETYIFYKRTEDGQRGTERADFQDVLEDYRRITATRKGRAGADEYEKFATVDLSPGDVDLLFYQDRMLYMGEILGNTGRFPKYLTYPLDAQVAILDRVYNRGMTNIKKATPFIDAIRYRNWLAAEKAVDNEYVRDVNAERNARVKEWFRNAAQEEPYFVWPKCGRKTILQFRP